MDFDYRAMLTTELFQIGETVITVSSVITASLIFIAGWILTRVLDSAVVRRMSSRFARNEGTLNAMRRLVRYVLMATTFMVALHTIGIDLGALFTAGAIFAVGIGFAMQNIAQNFVSGVILLVERSIKPGDILVVDGAMVRVESMGIRATIARTREEEQLIIPNSSLVQSTVTNYMLSDDLMRLRVRVGVTYSSDMREVRRVLEHASNSLTGRFARDPVVILVDFGDSAVVWETSIWVDSPWDERVVRGRLLEAIWNDFQDADIVIAFPQLDVHFDPGVVISAPQVAAPN